MPQLRSLFVKFNAFSCTFSYTVCNYTYPCTLNEFLFTLVMYLAEEKAEVYEGISKGSALHPLSTSCRLRKTRSGEKNAMFWSVERKF